MDGRESPEYFYRKAVNIVHNLSPESNYYHFLMREEVPKTRNGKIDYLLEFWEDEKEKALILHKNIDDYYNRKKENDHYNAVDKSIGADAEDFRNFLKFDEQFDLKPYKVELKIRDQVKELEYKFKAYLSLQDNYRGKHLNLYLWTRSHQLDWVYAGDKLHEGVPNTRFGQKLMKLNRYKCALEMATDKIVDQMFVVNFHPSSANGCEVREVQALPSLKESYGAESKKTLIEQMKPLSPMIRTDVGSENLIDEKLADD